MKVKSIERITPEPSLCIEVNTRDRLFRAGGSDGAGIVSHNSVAQRNIINACIMRPEHWRFLGIDLKRVELSQFRKYSETVLGVATEVESALVILRFAQQAMMKRYTDMEAIGVNNFLDLPDRGQALLVMVDEMGELLTPTGVKALSENTYVPNLNGRANLGEIEEGDIVFDSEGNLTEVEDKYAPVTKVRYDMTITRDSDGESETFVSGDEHYWVCYFTYPNGDVVGPKTVDTQFLYDFAQLQKEKPEAERVGIKFKKITTENIDIYPDENPRVKEDIITTPKEAELEEDEDDLFR